MAYSNRAYGFGGPDASQDFREAANALRKLAEKEGLSKARQAVAMALLDPIRERFLTQTKVKESQVRLAHWRRLLGQSPKNGRYRGADDYQNVDDHCSLWNRDRKRWAYISQPYVLETDDLREIVKRCDENGLHAQIRADASWHFPGMTVAVIWTRKHTRIIL